MAAPKLIFSTPAEIKLFRRKNEMSQAEFWSRIGVTQSGGSRYESGRSIPRPVQQLLHVVYAPDARSQRLVDYLRTWKAPAEAEADAESEA